MSPGIFNPPLVGINTSLSAEQRARGAALLVAQQVRPTGSVTELLLLARYVLDALEEQATENVRNPYELFGENQMDLDPVHTGQFRPSHVHNFGDLDREGEDRDHTFQGDPEDGGDLG